MILDGSHKKWCFATLLLCLLATAGYVWYARATPGGPRGGGIVGMLYGIAGSALMLFAGLISLRKKVPTWRIGSAQTWLRGHIWLGSLSVVLILFHAGFRWGGPLEQALLLVLAAVIVSGVIDLGVQQFLPRQMTARVPLETFYAQLPFECGLLQVEGDVAVAAICGPLPVEADKDVATENRLKGLGVKSRDRHQPLLTVVYHLPGGENGHAPVAAPAALEPKPAAVAAGPSAAAIEHGEPRPGKPSSAAEKIALMRSLNHATAKPPEPVKAPAEPVEAPAEPVAQAAAASEAAPNAKLTAAEKIALMRAGKKPPPPAAPTSPADPPASDQRPSSADALAESGEKKPLSAAEKIALMRASKKPAASPPASAVEPPPLVKEVSPAATAVATEAKKPLSAADKIALMRAAKKPAVTTNEASAAPPEVKHDSAQAPAATEAPAKPLSAAEKIALMRKQKGANPEPAAAAAPTPAKTAVKKTLASGTEKTTAAAPADAESQPGAVEGLRKFYVESVRPFLAYNSQGGGALASEVNAGGVFAVVGAGLPEGLRPVMDRLGALCEKRRQLWVQERIHRVLHFWLFIHVPLSLTLLGLGVAHAVMSVYY